MILQVKEIDGVAVVAVEDSMLQEDAVKFRQVMAELIEQNKTRIVLDMNDTQYISSMCLAAIVSNKKKAKLGDGDIKLAGINPLIYRLLETTKLIGELQTYSNIDEAIAAFNAE